MCIHYTMYAGVYVQVNVCVCLHVCISVPTHSLCVYLCMCNQLKRRPP